MNSSVISHFLLITIITQLQFVKNEYVLMPCESDNDCNIFTDSAGCVKSTCVCEDGCKTIKNETIVSKIGESCTRLADCNINESFCRDNKCACKKGFIESGNGKKCLKVSAGIGSSCLEDNQCNANVSSSICVNGSCGCGHNMYFHKDICIANRTLGEYCNTSEECTVEYSECNDGICNCVKRYVRSGEKCLLKAKTFLSPCNENIQCEMTLGTESECIKGYCNCKELYQFKPKSNKCIRDLLLGEVCAQHEECHQPGSAPSRLQCVEGECTCRSPYTRVDDYCISGASGNVRVNLGLTSFILLIFRFLM